MSNEFQIFDERFRALLLPESKLDKLADGCIWSEGPCYLPAGYVVWSDIPNNRMLRWDESDGSVSVFRQPSNFTNGHTLDLQGRLISCEHGGRRVSRTEADGSVVGVVDNYQGTRLNSPNDVVVKSDGTLWFTDPPYGILPGTKEGYETTPDLDGCYVFRFDPSTEEISLVIDDMERPNGLAFSPDEQRLYVADTAVTPERRAIYVYDVVDGKTTSNGRLFTRLDNGASDGFRFDANGYLVTSSGDSIQFYTEAGEHLGKIMVPEKIANCCFGGKEGNRLFITASSSLYAITLNTSAAARPRA
jgi:gluconolactonase